MIGTSLPAYVFIRACVFFLHSIAPLSALYCVVSLCYTPPYAVPKALQVTAAVETAFFVLVYFPHRLYLQRAAAHPPPVDCERRRELFRRCHDNIPDPEEYLSRWFMGAPSSEIKRNNVKEFLNWAFFNAAEPCAEYEEELSEYVGHLEELLGRKLEKGTGKARCIRLTVDKVDMLHRSLTWYMCVFVVDTLASIYLRFQGFYFHRNPLSQFYTVFPPRPLHLLSSHHSPAPHLTYWHRPHTSKTRLPILFIHGIGIGLYPYKNFLAELTSDDTTDSSDGQIGIIAVEIMSVSFRITGEALSKEHMCDEIESILNAHNWDKFVLVSHSYGSVISTHLLRSPRFAARIGPILFIDPVSFLLHLPDVAYNFTCKTPRRANEWQLYYFGAKDPGVAHALGRRFFWSDNILWKEDIQQHLVSVAIGERDLIVDTAAVRKYLEGGKNGVEDAGLRVLWFEGLDHAQVFDKRRTRRMLGNVVRAYCANR
ncbi:hypothetical protein EJ05DRAFT_312137 [Pseudovirgaria hyperparasitica]|uniref:AB hydrolase-1 domain-containing protein n=1 Tax=Pseudovirgaria hyperparasitica TaxID=470096 RepID=A0A6A6WAH7_9PEZI|nr:uncharacterized protein EJ05DRAFT_312137 [Pseudovirgaria hyperparasitica]KAF2759862.1 hypothetical protein EJ05DRAFT_312137 [Pseudovirgaria hyperparasitica]